MFPCQFCKICFIEHLWWLLLPTLKPLDLQKQLCQWIFKLVTIYFISTFLVLIGIFMFIFGEHRLSFYIPIALWLRRYDAFVFSFDCTIEVSHDFLGGDPSSWFSTQTSFGGHGPCECGHKMFLICRVATWLCEGGPLIPKHQSAKFAVNRPCKSGDIMFFVCHVTTMS